MTVVDVRDLFASWGRGGGGVDLVRPTTGSELPAWGCSRTDLNFRTSSSRSLALSASA